MDVWKQLLNRMMRAARLDNILYEEMETEREASGQAIMIALLVSAAAGLGMGITGIIGMKGPLWFLWGLLSGFFVALAGWLVWIAITYLVGTTVLRGHDKTIYFADFMGTLGYANSPGLVMLLCFVPMIGWGIILLAGIWILAAGMTAIRQTLEFDPGRALATCLPGWLVYMAGLLLVYFWLPSPYKMLPF